jgi:hypothetical protein
MAREPGVRALTPAQRAYEEKRAAKAGMSLERWLEQKAKHAQAEAKAREKVAEAKAPKKQGLVSRLLDRAHKPL